MLYAMLNLDKLWTVIMIGGGPEHPVGGWYRAVSHPQCVCVCVIINYYGLVRR